MNARLMFINNPLQPAQVSPLAQVSLACPHTHELISWLLESGKDLDGSNADTEFQHILEEVAQATQSSRASLMLLDKVEAERVLVIKAAVGFPAEVIINTRVKVGEGIAGWVVQERRHLLLPGGPNIPPELREMMAREGITASLCVALEVEGDVLGVLDLARQGDAPPFTSRDLWLVSLVADRMSRILHSARLYSQLESRERFITSILESIPSSLVVIDRALRIVSVNRNFLEKGRRDARATLGRKIENVFPQALVVFTHLDHKAQEVFRTGQPLEGGKVAYRAPDLPSCIYYYRLIPLKAGEAVENVMLLMDDITDREQLGAEVRRAERHLASVVDCANDLVISLDPQGCITTWNRAAERVSGLKAEQVNGCSLLSICAAERRTAMAEMLHKLACGESVHNIEVNLLTTKGEEAPIAWSCSPMRDDIGQVVGIVAVGRDLTEQRAMEAQLLQSAKMTSLGVMAGGIAHEVRNPLGIISASAQLLLEHPDDAQFRNQCMQKIQTATQRASLIIENLLKFSRPGGGRMQQVCVVAVLEEAFTLLGHQMTLQNIILRQKLSSELPTVYGNPDLLRQVFINLVINACNAMPQGGMLTVIAKTTASQEVEIQFRDTGCGIPTEHLPKIYDPFFTTMPVGKGTGLGLSISYSIIQQHHGNIKVKSRVNRGTTFIVRLPGTQVADSRASKSNGAISYPQPAIG